MQFMFDIKDHTNTALTSGRAIENNNLLFIVSNAVWIDGLQQCMLSTEEKTTDLRMTMRYVIYESFP